MNDLDLQEFKERLEDWARFEKLGHRSPAKVGDAVAQMLEVAEGKETACNFKNSELRSLPAEIGQLQSLQNLYLHNNLLTTLPSQIGQLTNLQALWLNDNQLTNFPIEIGQLTSLKELPLQSNRLTTLPTQIGQLKNIEYLSLESNRLTTLPTQIGQLKNLKYLSLRSNRLTNLPIEIGQLTSLGYLDLGENQLINLPIEIGQLTSLKEFHLQDNRLTTIPIEIGQLTKLELYVQRNPLYFLPDLPDSVRVIGEHQKISTILQSASDEVLDLHDTGKTTALIEYAQAKIAESHSGSDWAIENSSFINQLIYNKNLHDHGELSLAQAALCKQYLALPRIAPFVRELNEMALFEPEQREGFIFVRDRNYAVYISRECYAKNVLRRPLPPPRMETTILLSGIM